MTKDTVFQQILKPLTKKLLAECSKRFQSDYDYELFKTADHLKAMIFSHLSEIKSLRALEVAINGRNLGLSHKIRRSTLSDANRNRPAEAFFWILDQLMLLLPRKRCTEIKEVVRLLDSSPIQLRSHGYDWAKPYATRHIQGLKLHVEYDLTLAAPIKIAMSHANCNDIMMGHKWLIKPNTFYVFDKGYYDFNWWWAIHQKGAWFVTRLKKNVAISMLTQREMIDETIEEDGTFRFKNKNPRGGKVNLYQESLRRISIKREGKKPLILVTNRHDLPAAMIGQLYKARWEIELFFKWIKQNLKIKKFLGKTANAVNIQIATALIAYLLVWIFKKITKDTRALYLVLVWARHHLEKRRSSYRGHSPPIYSFEKRKVHL
jgi:putative transposase